jgi:hypothetical protein
MKGPNRRSHLAMLLLLTMFLPATELFGTAVTMACGASECSYDQGCYSTGACRGAQRCENDGGTMSWIDDQGCVY